MTKFWPVMSKRTTGSIHLFDQPTDQPIIFAVKGFSQVYILIAEIPVRTFGQMNFVHRSKPFFRLLGSFYLQFQKKFTNHYLYIKINIVIIIIFMLMRADFLLCSGIRRVINQNRAKQDGPIMKMHSNSSQTI